MGYGGIQKSEDNLTSFGNTVNSMGAVEQQTAANEQATSYQQQATEATTYAAEQEGMEEYTIGQTAGAQQEGYAAGGVESGEGTPLAMVNSTRALGNLVVQSIGQQGALQASMLDTEAQVEQQSGLEDVLSSEGENVTNTQENRINQAIQNTQELDSWLTFGLGALGSVAGGYAGSPSGSAAITNTLSNLFP